MGQFELNRKNSLQNAMGLWVKAELLDNALSTLLAQEELLKKLEFELEALKARVAEGTEEDSVCNRRCLGVMVIEKDGACSCHINPPCSSCVNAKIVCSECGFEVE